MLETPRSSRIASAFIPFAASCPSTVANSPRRKRAGTPVRRRNRSKYVRAVASRSIAISFPSPRRSAARSAAWPPAPKVASTTVSPRSTARSSLTSSARTGTWSVALGCKAFGNMLRPPFDFLDQRSPHGPIPDLEVVVHAGHHDLASEAGVSDERGRQHDPTLLVGCSLGCGGEEVALHHAVVAAERIEVGK